VYAEGRTGMTKLMGAFRDYADATKNRMEIVSYKEGLHIICKFR